MYKLRFNRRRWKSQQPERENEKISRKLQLHIIECPGKPNLLPVCLLICRVFWFLFQQIWFQPIFHFSSFSVPVRSCVLSAHLLCFLFCFFFWPPKKSYTRHPKKDTIHTQHLKSPQHPALTLTARMLTDAHCCSPRQPRRHQRRDSGNDQAMVATVPAH